MGSEVLNPSKQGGQPRDEAMARGAAVVQLRLEEVGERGHTTRAIATLASRAYAASAEAMRTTRRPGTSNPITAGSPGGMLSSPMQKIGGGMLTSGSATYTS